MTSSGRVVLEHAEVAGELVQLRPSSAADAAASFELVHDQPAITDWILWDGPESIEELEERYSCWAQEREDRTLYAFSIVERASGEWAGSIGVWHYHEEPVAVLGYLVGVPYQGRGLGTEAVSCAVELAFRELQVLLIRAEVFANNLPSIRILEKVGMRHDEGEEIFHEKRGAEVLSHSYSISRVDWELAAPPKGDWQVRSARAD